MKSEFTEKQGERLSALLRNRHIKQCDIYKKFMSQYDLASAKVIFSNYCHGKKEIPTELLIDISKELNVDAGYLIGYDKFFVKSYEEYVDFMHLMGDSDFEKYDSFFKHADLWLSSDPGFFDEEFTYNLFHHAKGDHITKNFTQKDMKNFYKIACKKIVDLFMQYISYDEYENLIDHGTTEDWVDFLKWHENFFEKDENRYFLNKEAKEALEIIKAEKK